MNIYLFEVAQNRALFNFFCCTQMHVLFKYVSEHILSKLNYLAMKLINGMK